MMASSPVAAADVNAELQIQTEFATDQVTEVVFVDEQGKITQRGFVLNGLKTGIWTSYNAEGDVTAQASFLHGKKDGKWKIYNEGRLEYIILYKNDVKVWAEQYDAKGNLTSVTQ